MTFFAYLTLARDWAPLLGIALAILLITLLAYIYREPLQDRKERIGLGHDSNWIVIPLALIYAAVFLYLLTGLLVVIWQVISFQYNGGQITNEEFLFFVLRLAGLTTVLGAVIALPVTLTRLRLNRDQTELARQGLITDRIHNAIEQLGHEDRSVRMGALYQLERIMTDSSVDRTMVLKTLNSYIQYHQSKTQAQPAPGTELQIDLQAALEILLKRR